MRALFIILFFLTPIITYGQEKLIVSDLENLELSIGDSFTPSTFVVDLQNNRSDCERMIYYNKRGVFSTANSISVDNQSGTITANKPGSHEVVAVCFGKDKKRVSRTFQVNVKYPKVKEINVTLNTNKVYTGTYLPISYEVIDEMGFKRDNVNFSLNSTNDILSIDPINNIKAIKEGKTTLEATFDGITGRINIEVFDNPVTSIELKSNLNELRTGDVVQFDAKAYDKRGNEVTAAPL